MALVTVDFDGTLFQGNSFKVMFQTAKKDFSVKEWVRVVAGLFKALAKGAIGGKVVFKHEFFRSFARAFRGKTREELDDFFLQLVHMGRKQIHQGLVAQIQGHLKKGDMVIVLSGALRPFLDAVITTLNLNVYAIGTELKYDASGVATGELGTIVNGYVKVEKVQAWIRDFSPVNQESLQWYGSLKELWAYADSLSDVPLLQYVHYPVVVNPNADMKKVADEHGWPLFTEPQNMVHTR